MVLPSVAIGLAGTAMAALGIFLTARRDSELAVRVLGAYFVLRGIVNASNGFQDALMANGVEVAPPFSSLGAASARVIPFLVLVFASLYPRRRGPLGRSRKVRWAVYGVAVAVGGFRLLREVSSDAVVEGIGNSLLVLVPWTLLLPSYMLVGMVFVRDYFHEAPVPDRDGLLFVAVGFMFDGIYLGVENLLDLINEPIGNSAEVTMIVALLALVPVVGLLGRNALRTGDPGERRKMGWTLLGLLLPIVLAFLVSPVVNLGGGRAGAGIAVDALSIVAFPLLIVYGGVRQELLGIDADLSRGVKYSAAAIVLVGSYAAISLTAQIQLGGVAGQTVAVLATGVLVLATVSLALTWRPEEPGWLRRDGVPYLGRGAVDVYQETLKEALAVGGGRVKEDDEGMLERMRERLGVTDREHAVLLHALESEAGRQEEELLSPGKMVAGRYRVEEELDAGGHGATYVAHDTQLDRTIVLKQLHRSKGSLDLNEEARRLGSLDHPSIVTVHDVLAVGDRVLLVMEYLPAGSLADRLEAGPLGLDAFETAAKDALGALEVVHAAGMVHRDVKPGNLLLTEEGHVKLTDFGISRVTGDETTMGLDAEEPVGTLRYMSPEQAKGQPVDERSDLFSLAATLYEAYTGDPYITVEPGESMVEVQMRVAGLGPFDEEVDGPEELERWFAKAMAPRPEDRFAGAREMREALDEVLGAGTPEQRK